MAEKHKVTYDSSTEKAFVVHLPHKVVKFHQLNSRLYGMNPKEPNKVFTQVEQKYVLGQLRDDNLKLLSTVSLDGMEVNSLKFITTIAHDLYYGTAQYISKPVKSQYVKVLDKLHSIYKNNEFVWEKFTVTTSFIPS